MEENGNRGRPKFGGKRDEGRYSAAAIRTWLDGPQQVNVEGLVLQGGNTVL